MGCSPPLFTTLTGDQIAHTLSFNLIAVADRLRDLRVRFGQRPYRVRIVRTQWSGGARGLGQEYVTSEMEILPTPAIVDMNTLSEIVEPIGLEEIGMIMLTEVSGRYTEDDLRNQDSDGDGAGVDQNVFFEIEFPRPDNKDSIRRRFFLRAAPMYQTDKFQWTLRLERAHPERTRAGLPGPG